MSIKIEIKSATVTPRNITVKNGPRAGQQATFHEQEAWAYTIGNDGKPHPYPQRITLNVEIQEGQAAFPVGFYSIDPASFYVNRFNGLEIGRLKLQPLQAQAAVKAAA